MTNTQCYRCGELIDIQEDEWWQYSWEENPSKNNVEKAIENPDFREWFSENHVLCVGCHEVIQVVFDGANPNS